MNLPDDYKLLETHEWHKVEGDTVTIGITHFAADELTDITYVALPKAGTTLKAGDRFGEIESVKATSDLYTGVAGTVTAVNDALANDPGTVNRDSYAGGWMIRIKLTNPADLTKLLSAADYLKKTGH
jgi:glycine cleavage system H protein